MSSKQVRGYFFSLFIIIQYCTPNIYYATKNVFKTSDRLFFSLSNHFSNLKKNVYSNKVKTCYFSNTKNACSKQAGIIQKMLAQNKRGTTFQFIKLLFVIQKMRVPKKARGSFCNTKNVCSKQVRGCFLVY